MREGQTKPPTDSLAAQPRGADTAPVATHGSSWFTGEAGSSLSDVLPDLYTELRRIAAGYMRQERADHTLQTTALVHEAYLRLSSRDVQSFPSRADFFAAAAQAIRRVLIDHARARNAIKRGGAQPQRLQVAADELAAGDAGIDLLDLDTALNQLADLSPRQARVVELRFFGGMSEEEIAQTLGISRRTTQEDWRGARAWLQRALRG